MWLCDSPPVCLEQLKCCKNISSVAEKPLVLPGRLFGDFLDTRSLIFSRAGVRNVGSEMVAESLLASL